MEHGLLAKMSGVLLEYGYDLVRLTDKKDGRIIVEIRRKDNQCLVNIESLIDLDVEIEGAREYMEKE